MRARVLTVAALLAAATPAWAGGTIVLDQPGMRTGTSLSITSTAFTAGGAIPGRYSSYERDVSVPLAWSAGPPGTMAYVVMIEDPDAASPTPIVHWLVWDIAPDTLSLAEDVKASDIEGARLGVNSHGTNGYYGPHPPAGDPPHHYHIEVFALDRPLAVATGQTIDAVAKAMTGHVLAQGEVVGTFAKAK